jgi:hypothetical protein
VTVLEAALDLREEGFSIIPCSSNKKPCIESWKKYQKEIADENTVRQWFENTENNIGIVCGEVSGNLIVFDFDDMASGETWRKDHAFLINGAPVVRTGRGLHIYIKTETPIRSSRCESFEVRSEGCYIVAPPSVHESGAVYALISGDLAKIPTIPAEFLGLDTRPLIEQAKELSEEKKLIEGNRNSELFADACAMRARGFGAEAVLAGISAENKAQCNPPLDEDEVRRIADSALRYGPSEKPEEEEKPPRILSVSDILEYPLIDYVVDLYAPRESLVNLSAYSGLGKSVFVSALTISTMSALPFLGKFRVRHPGSVLFFDEETPKSYWGDRAKKMGFRVDDPFFLAHFLGYKLDDDKGFNMISNLVAQYSPVLVVFDTLIRFHTGDENSAAAMAPVMGRLRKIANMGPCVYVLIHQNKNSADVRLRSRGSSDIIGACDLELALMEKGPKDHKIIELRSVKARLAPVSPINLKIEEVEGVLSISECDDWNAEQEEAMDSILRESETGLSITAIHAALTAQGVEITRRTVANRLKKMDIPSTEGPRHARIYRIADDT